MTKTITKKLSPVLSVIINEVTTERRYLDEHNNELLYAKRSEGCDQWFITLPRDVFEAVEMSGGIAAQFVHSSGALEHIALALRSEMLAAGY